MPRQARIDAPGALHHIIARGIERRRIFRTRKDYLDFIDRLSSLLDSTGTRCYAWALIPNHFHLLLKTGSVPIATVMRRLLTGYAVSFNNRHCRHGHVFQNRYKSILCQEETYLKELVRYIHLNPLCPCSRLRTPKIVNPMPVSSSLELFKRGRTTLTTWHHRQNPPHHTYNSLKSQDRMINFRVKMGHIPPASNP